MIVSKLRVVNLKLTFNFLITYKINDFIKTEPLLKEQQEFNHKGGKRTEQRLKDDIRELTDKVRVLVFYNQKEPWH